MDFMDILIKLIFWIHLVALVGGGTASVALPIVGAQLAGATPEARTKLFAVANAIGSAARGALGALIITGPILFWLKWNFTAPSMIWFGIKMVLVLALLAGVIVATISSRKAQQGDMEAAKRAAMLGRVNALALLGIILAAVFAFD